MAGPLPLLLLGAEGAHAQTREIGSTAPLVYADDKEYREQPIRLGGLSVSLGGEARIEYDDNVYAQKIGKEGDARFEITPSLRINTAPAPLRLQVNASGTARRFARLTSENVDMWYLDAALRWAPGPASIATGRMFVQRSVEDRGDPESNTGPQFGPRQTDLWGAEARYRRDSGRLLLDLEATATRYDAVARRDDNRDFSGYAARATFGLRTTKTIFITATAFASRREFRLDRTSTGARRNSSTYGARLGIDIQPGGLFEGNLSAGVFRFDSDDPQTPGKTGISVAGNLIYRPRRRTAIVLNASSGDVVTFRNGAQQRTDTIVKLSIQQEIRHDIFARPMFGLRETKYNRSLDTQRTITFGGEVEYIASRSVSVTASVTYGERNFDEATANDFKRVRAGVSVRARF